MGFPEERCKRALIHFKNRFEATMEHLVSVDDSMDADIFGPAQQ
jgi:uncharacterized UBP type Zn finger protein